MKLRPRQELAVERSVEALRERGNTVLIAPTGAGKTVILSDVARRIGGSSIVLQHRDELVAQNRKTFFAVNPKTSSELFTADRKRFARDGATFAMVQTLVRNLDNMPPVDTLIVDEAHHIAADSYLKIINRVRQLNDKAAIFGVTATANRGDKKALRGVFSNVADQITLKELIGTGFLVKPRTFVIDLGTQDALRGVRKTASDFDMAEVEKIMDREVLNEKIVEEWKRLAGNRQTVVFAATIAHAEHVANAFKAAGTVAAVVSGEMGEGERRSVLADFDAGHIQVIVNVAVLTEGWDCQPVSCVVLLRPSSYKSTMIQMIGRGLRKLDPERYPGRHKDDCIVLDFGTSILTHGAIEDEVNLDGKGTKTCPECQAQIPSVCRDCPLCGYAFPTEADTPTKHCAQCGEKNPVSARNCIVCGAEFPKAESADVLDDFVLTEVDLLEQSPYKWEPLFDGAVLVATAFDAWSMAVNYGGRWHAIGGAKELGVKLLADAEDRLVALASADDFLREHGDQDGGSKTRRWLSQPPTDKQLATLGVNPMDAMAHGITRYKAACHLTWRFNERVVRKRLEGRMLAA